MKTTILLLLNSSKARRLENSINLMDEDNMIFMKKYGLNPFDGGLIQDYSSDERDKSRVFQNLAQQFMTEESGSEDEEDTKAEPKVVAKVEPKAKTQKEEAKVEPKAKTQEEAKAKVEEKAEEKQAEEKVEEKKDEAKAEEK